MQCWSVQKSKFKKKFSSTKMVARARTKSRKTEETNSTPVEGRSCIGGALKRVYKFQTIK